MSFTKTGMGSLNPQQTTFAVMKVAASQTLEKGDLLTVDSSGYLLICPTSWAGATQTYVLEEEDVVTSSAEAGTSVAKVGITGPFGVMVDAAVNEGSPIKPSDATAGQVEAATAGTDDALGKVIGNAMGTSVGGSNARLEIWKWR